MRIVFIGSGEFGCDSLRWLESCEHKIAEVVTQPARPAGRGKKLIPTAIAQLADELGLCCHEAEDINQADFVEHIAELQPNVLLVIAFGQKIGPELLNLPNCRTINLHGSLLPKYRGAAPINWAIINGEKQTGITVIELTEKWDAGCILGQLSTAIEPDETAGDLHDRMAKMGPELLEQVLSQIDQGIDKPIVQDNSQASRAPKLGKTDGAIRWSQSAKRIRDQIHGMWPWPGAYCHLARPGKKAERISIAQAAVSTESDAGSKEEMLPGTLCGDLSIACGTGRLKLLQVKPANGKLMNFADFVNGRHLKTHDRFLDG